MLIIFLLMPMPRLVCPRFVLRCRRASIKNLRLHEYINVVTSRLVSFNRQQSQVLLWIQLHKFRLRVCQGTPWYSSRLGIGDSLRYPDLRVLSCWSHSFSEDESHALNAREELNVISKSNHESHAEVSEHCPSKGIRGRICPRST